MVEKWSVCTVHVAASRSLAYLVLRVVSHRFLVFAIFICQTNCNVFAQFALRCRSTEVLQCGCKLFVMSCAAMRCFCGRVTCAPVVSVHVRVGLRCILFYDVCDLQFSDNHAMLVLRLTMSQTDLVCGCFGLATWQN